MRHSLSKNTRLCIKEILPPVLLRVFKNLVVEKKNQFVGDYLSWREASMHATGYDSEEIFSRVRVAALSVKRGEAVFERDSVCFYHEEFRWPVLACLMTIAAERGGQLSVLDFGGALGGFYFQHRKFLSCLPSLRWCVVEQQKLVEIGRAEFQEEGLEFYMTIDECMSQGRGIDVAMLSSVLPYLEDPRSLLSSIAERNTPYIVVDRTPFSSRQSDRISIQKVPDDIFPAAIPAWILSEGSFDNFMCELGYARMASFPCDEIGIHEAKFEGILYGRKKS